MMLEVRSTNEDAIGMYEGLGFHAIATRSRYYPDGGDAVIMRLRLPGGVAMTFPRGPVVLGVETSCDETGIGIVIGDQLCANDRFEYRRAGTFRWRCSGRWQVGRTWMHGGPRWTLPLRRPESG